MASPLPPFAVTAPFNVMRSLSMSRMLPPPTLAILLTTNAPVLRIVELPAAVLFVVIVETLVSRLMPFAAVSVAVGALTLTNVPLPSMSAPPAAVSEMEFVATILPTVKSPAFVIERLANVVPRLPPAWLKSVETVRFPDPPTVPAESVSVPTVAAPSKVATPPLSSVPAANVAPALTRILPLPPALTSEAPPVLNAPPFSTVTWPSFRANSGAVSEPTTWMTELVGFARETLTVFDVPLAALRVAAFVMEPVPPTVAPESVSVPLFWNCRLSVSEPLSVPRLPTPRVNPPPEPIKPPFQVSTPEPPATATGPVPVRLPDKLKPLVNWEALVRPRDPAPAIATGASAIRPCATAPGPAI